MSRNKQMLTESIEPLIANPTPELVYSTGVGFLSTPQPRNKPWSPKINVSISSNTALTATTPGLLYIERYGPRKTLTVATFTEVLNKLISFMHTRGRTPVLGVPHHHSTCHRHQQRRSQILPQGCYPDRRNQGQVHLRQSSAQQTIRYYPNYTDHTDGQTFNMMLASEDGKPRRLNYYTVIGCEHWNGRKYNSLPADWKIEVIRLCSKQKSIHLHEEKDLLPSIGSPL